MTVHRNRFDFALERLGSGDWERFENLASQFLVAEFSILRTLATPSGDGGRDAVLFSPIDDPSVVLQYSVTPSWEVKIKKTIARIIEQGLDVSILIYVSNQVIGAKSDELKKLVRQKHRIMLDIKDRSWFLDRVNNSRQNEEAAESLAIEIVDPYLASKEITSNKAQALNNVEARAAFVFLALQLEDETREKGLTKLSFEAIVRSVLRNTNSEKRLSRKEIYFHVQAILPNHNTQSISRNIDTVLNSLSKRVVKHWKKEDEFCLAAEEIRRINDRLSDVERNNISLQMEIQDIVSKTFKIGNSQLLTQLTERIRRVLEKFLLSKGELFVAAVLRNQYYLVGTENLTDFITRDVAEHPLSKAERSFPVEVFARSVIEIISDPGISIREHLRSLTDAYTLLAFLRETSDVQSAVSKMFSHGDIWLDTNIILPLFVETLLPVEQYRFITMINAANEAGLKLYVTHGVLEEIERHMNRALTCNRKAWNEWDGPVPFLYSFYIQTGNATSTFPKWLETFRGSVRPEDDIADYLRITFGIDVADLEEEARSASSDLRMAVQEAWHSEHDRRRQRLSHSGDSLTALRLANHDVENFLGVLYRRRNERSSSLGYSSWWLTLDKAAFNIEKDIRYVNKFGTPVMSPDFMMNYLALGPVRMRVSRQTEKVLPVALDLRLTEVISPDLIQVANDVREKSKDLPEHMITRRVRDELDAAKSRPGKYALGGLQAIEEELLRSNTKA